jgi:hypothetical protein
MSSHTKKHEQSRKTYNNGVYVKRLTYDEFEVDYYGKLENVIELQCQQVWFDSLFYSNVIDLIQLIEGLE